MEIGINPGRDDDLNAELAELTTPRTGLRRTRPNGSFPNLTRYG
jgi:hypothetical protein